MQERKLSAVMQGASLGVEAVPPRQRLLHLPRQRLRKVRRGYLSIYCIFFSLLISRLGNLEFGWI